MSKNIFKKLDFILSRKAFMIALIFECIIKNLSFISYGKYAIYFICIYAFLIILYRFIFKREYLFDKKLIIGYLFVLSALIPCFIYRFQGLYNDIVIIVIFVTMFFIVSYFNVDESKDNVIYEFVFIFRFISIIYFFYTISSLLIAIALKKDILLGLLNISDFYSYNCLTVIGCSVFLLIYEKKIVFKAFNILNILLHLLAIIFTQARAVYLAIIIGIMFSLIIIFLIKKERAIANIKIICIVLLLLFVSCIVFFSFSSFNINRIINKLLYSGLTGREFIWSFGLFVYIHNNMFFGLSYGALPIIWTNNILIHPEYLFVTTKNPRYFQTISILKKGYAHNIYLQQLFTHGMFGLLLFVFWLFVIFQNIIKLIISEKINDDFIFSLIISANFIIIGQLFVGFFNNNILFNIVYISQIMFFYVSGIILYIDKEKKI